MILVDANVLMYAAGAPSDFKDDSVRFLERVAEGAVEAALDAEILQELLHRYRSIDRWEEGRQTFDHARVLFPIVLPITDRVLDRARDLLDADPRLMARDAVHASVVLVHELEAICSYDRDFDGIGGLTRIEPGTVIG